MQLLLTLSATTKTRCSQIINFLKSILKRQKAGPGPLSPASPSLPVAVCEAPLGGEVELYFGGVLGCTVVRLWSPSPVCP